MGIKLRPNRGLLTLAHRRETPTCHQVGFRDWLGFAELIIRRLRLQLFHLAEDVFRGLPEQRITYDDLRDGAAQPCFRVFRLGGFFLRVDRRLQIFVLPDLGANGAAQSFHFCLV